MKPSQNDQILSHLRQGKRISAYEALKLYGCFRLAARKRGHVIHTEQVNQYAVYWMEKGE